MLVKTLLLLLLLLFVTVSRTKPLPNPPSLQSSNGTLEATLEVSVGRVDAGEFSFNARLYGGKNSAPTFYLSAGDTFKLTLTNKLEANAELGHHNEFRKPNTTNIHTHGLHVNPEGEEDNIFLKAEPGQSIVHKYKIHANHLGGTHWYHPHYHGSTALQLGGGMAGVIVIRDDPNTVDQNLAAITDKILLFQYINVGANPPPGDLFAQHDGVATQSKSSLWMNPSGTGSVYLVNGEKNPTLTVRPQEWTRLRMVHATTGVNLRLVVSGGCEMQLIATDGVYLHDRTPLPIDAVSMVAGSRRDVLLRCNTTGMHSMSSSTSGNTPFLFDKEEAILSIQVNGTANPMASVKVLPALPSYLNDLRDSSPTAKFSITFNSFNTYPIEVIISLCAVFAVMSIIYLTLWYRGVLANTPWPFSKGNNQSKSESNHRGSMLHWLLPVFVLLFVILLTVLLLTTGFRAYAINDVPFQSATSFVHTMSLGSVQEWDVRADHPFHMHVNHFQLISTGCTGECAFGFRSGDFYDTIMYGGGTTGGRGGGGGGGGSSVIRFQPSDFKGTAVLHCHILGHEDLGMMAVAKIE